MQKVRAAGEQYDWQSGPRRLNGSRELKTIHNGHRHVRDQAVNLRESATLEQSRRGRKQSDLIVRRVQQHFERLENPPIIVDHGNDSAVTVVGHDHAGILADRRAGRL